MTSNWYYIAGQWYQLQNARSHLCPLLLHGLPHFPHGPGGDGITSPPSRRSGVRCRLGGGGGGRERTGSNRPHGKSEHRVHKKEHRTIETCEHRVYKKKRSKNETKRTPSRPASSTPSSLNHRKWSFSEETSKHRALQGNIETSSFQQEH